MSLPQSEPPDPGVIEAIRIDLVRLHETWMGVAFPRQRDAKHSVLGKWKPRSTTGRLKYGVWSLFGLVVVAGLYPFAVLGLATRFYATQINRAAATVGLAGVVGLSILAWGTLTVFARLQFTYEGFVAVAAAGAVATISAMLAVVFSRLDGTPVTVLLAYPFGVTALFLPPVVAALYSPTIAQLVFPRSELLAIWILDNLLYVFGLNEAIRYYFDLEGLAYVGMWFGLAVPIGWFLGLLVTLADVVRPKPDAAD